MARWRTLRRWCLRLLLGAIAARVLLGLTLPWIVGAAGSAAGLAITYDTASLSLHRLSVRCHGLVVRDAGDAAAPPLLTAHELAVDLSLSRLLAGDLEITDAVVAGGRVHVRRTADGTVLLPAAWRTPAAEVAPAAADPEAAVDFGAPVRLRSVRLHDVCVVSERLGPAPLVDEVVVDVSATNIGCGEGPGQFVVRAHGPAVLDDLWLRATVDADERHLLVRWHGALRGLRPSTLPEALASLPVWGSVRALGVDLRGEFHARRDPSAPRYGIFGGSCTAAALVDDRPLLTLEANAEDSRRANGVGTLPFTVQMHGDELVDELRLDGGALEWSQTRAAVATKLRCRGLGLRFLAPWLAELGIALPADGIAAAATVAADIDLADGAPSVAARIDELEVSHGDDRVGIRRLAVTGARHTAGATTVEAIEVDAPMLRVAALPEGRFACAGIQWWTPPPADAPATATPAGTPATEWPRASVRRLEVRGIDAGFIDRTRPTNPAVSLANGSLRGSDLGLGRDQPVGRLVFAATVPDAVGAMRCDFRLETGATRLGADGDLSADAVTLGALRPWLEAAGAVPRLTAASLRARLRGQITLTAQGPRVSATLADLRLDDAGETLASIRRIEAEGLGTAGAGLHLGAWSIVDPFVLLQADAGGVAALGLHVAAHAPDPATGPSVPPAAAPIARPTAATGPTAPIAHGPLRVQGLELRWRDRAAGRDDVSFRLDADVDADRGDGQDVACAATLRIDGAVDALRVRGTYRRRADEFHGAATIDGNGIRGPGFTGLLPSHLRCTLVDGALRGRLEATAALRPTPSWALRADDWAVVDGGRELAAIDRVEIDVPAANPELIHVRSLRVGGIRAAATSTADGVALPAVTLTRSAAAPDAPAPAVPGGEAPALPGAAALLPPLRLDDVDIRIARLAWQDRTAGDGQPVVMSAHFRLAAPWATAADPADSEPLRLAATAVIDPLCRDMALEAIVAPYRIRPAIDCTVRAAGIDTTALAAVLPAAGRTIEGTATDAEFTCRVAAALDLRRRDVRRFDIHRPFGFEIAVSDVRFAPAGRDPWLAVEAVSIDARTFVPATGELALRTVEVEGPRLSAKRTSDGLETMGLRFRAAPSAATAPPAPRALPDPGPRVTLDRLHVAAIALDLVDETTTPSTRTPVHDGDLLVQGVALGGDAPRPAVSFTASAAGGDVELERRLLRSSLIAGVLGSATEAIAGAEDVHAREHRPWFDDLRIRGRVTPGPVPTGEIQVSVRSLELPALRGPAKAAGVDVADGALDVDVMLDLRGERGVRLESRSVFTWLSISEPANGPISTYLRLPLPLDTVLFLLRNDADEHVIPVAVDVPADGASTGAVAAAAGEALARVLADAVASSAFRLTGAVTGAFGLDPNQPLPPPTTFAFAPGESVTSSPIDAIVEALRADERLGVVLTHEASADDLQRADALANPPADVVAATVATLRAERTALLAQRDPLANDVAAAYATARLHDARALHAQLTVVDTRLFGLEQALDDALTMLVDDTARTRAGRARAAALAMATRRLDTLRLAIGRSLGEGGADRVDVRRPRAIAVTDAGAPGRVVATLRPRAAR